MRPCWVSRTGPLAAEGPLVQCLITSLICYQFILSKILWSSWGFPFDKAVALHRTYFHCINLNKKIRLFLVIKHWCNISSLSGGENPPILVILTFWAKQKHQMFLHGVEKKKYPFCKFYFNHFKQLSWNIFISWLMVSWQFEDTGLNYFTPFCNWHEEKVLCMRVFVFLSLTLKQAFEPRRSLLRWSWEVTLSKKALSLHGEVLNSNVPC